MSEHGQRPIMPRDTSAAPLDLVIGVMAFLAALTLGAALVANRAAESWRVGLTGRVTVQILPSQKSRSGRRGSNSALTTSRWI